MRQELNQIEKAVQYLNGEMSAADQIAYVQSMKENPEVARRTEEISLLEIAIKRKAIRDKIEAQAKGGFGKMSWILGGIILIAAGIFLWMIFHESENSIETSINDIDYIQNESAVIVEEAAENSSDHIFTLGGNELWVEPNVQTFRFDSRKGSTITGDQGMLIIVPAEAFTDKEGNTLTGAVEFRLVEALDIADMVLYKLQTVSDGAQLESGGMFYIEATVNGQEATVNPNRPLYIEIPTSELKAGMLGFRGEVVNGKINWVDPKPLQKYLVQIPLDSLDFLPAGFEAEVGRHMPFKHYTRATRTLVDSLYYALPDTEIASEEEPLSDTLPDAIRDTSVTICCIHPHTVETIKNSKFNRSFIATHEFEARIQALHKADKGDALLQMYIQYLDQNLWEVDAMVAAAASGVVKSQFEAFASQRLTRVEAGELHAAQLSAYYGKKRSEISTYRKNLAAQISRKNQQELSEIRNKLIDFDQQHAIFALAPGVNPATSPVYATPWYTMGWGNIDLYLKFLEGETKSVEIVVENASEKSEISQWLGEINSYTNLRENSGKYKAVFPKKRGKIKDTWIFALSGKAPEYQWAFQAYDPYKTERVELVLAEAKAADIRNDLQQVGERFGRIRAEREVQRQTAERFLNMQLAAQARTEEILRERQIILDALSAVARRQQAIQYMMGKLREVGYPCGIQTSEFEVSSQSLSVEEQIFTIVDQMPEFPGGRRPMMNYINRTIKYPRSAMDAGIEGTVYISFVVQTDGSIRNAAVIRGFDPACDAAALQMVNNMPRWTPGRQRNTVVPVQYNLPVKFELK